MFAYKARTIILLAATLTAGCSDEPESRPVFHASANFAPSTDAQGDCLNTIDDEEQEKLQTVYLRNRNFADVVAISDGGGLCGDSIKYTLTRTESSYSLTIDENPKDGEAKSTSREISDVEWDKVHEALRDVEIAKIRPEGCRKIPEGCQRNIAFQSDYTRGSYYSEDQANWTSADGFVSNASFQSVLDALKSITE